MTFVAIVHPLPGLSEEFWESVKTICRGIPSVGSVKMSTPQFDANLSDILQNVKQIDAFLDIVFEFLYRRLVFVEFALL